MSGRKVVTSIAKGHPKLRRPAIAHWALVVCGGKGAKWLNTNVRAGDRVKPTVTFTNGTPLTAVSGARVLVANGKTYDDVGGFALGPGPNPETFACTSKTGTSVLMGVVDGRSAVSYGLTYAQLTRYLKALKCYSGMVFDGGGSSTLVARLPGTTGGTTVRNVPSDGRTARGRGRAVHLRELTAARPFDARGRVESRVPAIPESRRNRVAAAVSSTRCRS